MSLVVTVKPRDDVTLRHERSSAVTVVPYACS